MIRMAPLPVGKNQHSWTLLTDYASDFHAVLPRVLHPPVGNVEGMPPSDAKDLRRIGSLASAIFRSAARAHLPLSKIKNAGAMAELCHLKQCAAAGLFDIVAMGGEG